MTKLIFDVVAAMRNYDSLPFSQDNEACLLCSMIQSREVLERCCDLPGEAFYIPAHRILYSALCDFNAMQRPVDFALLKDYLRARTNNRGHTNLLDEVGGPEGLSAMFNLGHNIFGNYQWYKDFVKSYYRRREAIRKVREIESCMRDLTRDIPKESMAITI